MYDRKSDPFLSSNHVFALRSLHALMVGFLRHLSSCLSTLTSCCSVLQLPSCYLDESNVSFLRFLRITRVDRTVPSLVLVELSHVMFTRLVSKAPALAETSRDVLVTSVMRSAEHGRVGGAGAWSCFGRGVPTMASQ